MPSKSYKEELLEFAEVQANFHSMVPSESKNLYNEFNEALDAGDVDELERLVSIGANVNVSWFVIENDNCCHESTSLHWASFHGKVDVVEFLISKGADVNAKIKVGVNKNSECSSVIGGDTPLHLASIRGHIDVVKLLVEKGANVNASNKWGDTPLHWASMEGHIDVVKLLIAKGAAVNAKDKRNGGLTSLQWASRNGHTDVAKILIANGAHDVNAENSMHGVKPVESVATELKQNVTTTLENNESDPRPTKRTKASSNSITVVEQWLKSYLPNLQREDACNYSKCLVEDGFDSIDTLDVLEEEHLGFMKTGHRLLLMKKLGSHGSKGNESTPKEG
jgi:ankyrin repeat protein